MKYSFFLIIAVTGFACSPKLSPDAGWGRQRWVLVEMKGVPVQQSGGRRDAFINFEVDQNRFRGNGGCNQVNGNYSVEKNNIHFSEVVSTKMSPQHVKVVVRPPTLIKCRLGIGPGGDVDYIRPLSSGVTVVELPNVARQTM